MILAYHRLPSSDVLRLILDAGVIFPGVYRLDPAVIFRLCEEELSRERGTYVGEALLELSQEAVQYFREAQAAFLGQKSEYTAFKCLDILSGDAGRIFLSPGTWSEAQRALGWPLTGFAFDAEALIQAGARVRREDFLSYYSGAARRTKEDPHIQSVEIAKKKFLSEIAKIHERELSGDEAIQALDPFRVQPGEEARRPHERKKYEWSSGMEIVWDGPLALDHVVEIRENDVLTKSRRDDRPEWP
jgi:hypothetical protein